MLETYRQSSDTH